MRTIERGAVYNGDTTVGFRCDICGKVVSSMLGEICSTCRNDEKKHQEFLGEILALRIRNARTGRIKNERSEQIN